MPANIKYLSTPGQRFLKITAGLIGGYLVTTTFHLALAAWFDRVNVIITLTYTSFVMWAILLILSFLARNGWRIWALYLLISAVFSLVIYLGKTNPATVG